MLPVVQMYGTCDYQQFQKQYRDYLLGFDEKEKTPKQKN